MNITRNAKRWGSLAAIAIAGSVVLSSCAANEPNADNTDSESTLSGTLVGGGASSQQTAQEAWVAAFQDMHPEVTVEYDPTGSGTGRDNFIAGANWFTGSDRAFDNEELAEDNFAGCVPGTPIIEIPAYISPIAIIFNLEGVDTLNLDAATIARIFKGEITQWNDEAIASQNPDVELPATPITAVHRSDESGTTENFADYLAAAAPEVWTAEVSGDWAWEGGEAAQGTSGVVDTVSGGEGTIGYADASRAGDLGTVAVKVGEEYVDYSAEAAAAIVDASPMVEGREDVDLAIELDRTSTAEGVYPIVLVSYLIACSEYEDAERAELVKPYLEYVISDEGQAVAAEAAGIAPISVDLYERAQAAVEQIS
ncbi:phosphate ABC transporter substrate-binding protein PstS [Salinibacterium sp. SYSU T00001]|uniref:phosphate ABC transporter substrate-binding protein PstS n=1 Tax=Homoserinimonas sedimenticola TaxID=2986805 RepID=UPI002235AA27|nr:phosphate ABC transporter substrate-binding protein PstS [Salinibacterium sedimenticola]MCW4386111.1 phosphate ABC transporter substrate-binding protein PstS [Salinibacterium sedimenticola]